MPIGVIAAVVVVVAVVATALLMRRSQDDVHSVEHYHRQLHTLEEIRGHTGGDHANGSNGADKADKSAIADGVDKGDKAAGDAYPASAVRVSGSSTVRLTE